MKFLIVDDSKAMQAIVHKALVTSGYSDHDYDYAFNGKDALNKIHASKPDVVLCDWHMPEMTGLELLYKIKQEQLDVKIGLVTTERYEDKIKEAKAAGALFIVSKPFTAETLAHAVGDALSFNNQSGAGTAVTSSSVVMPNQATIKKTLSSLANQAISVDEVNDFSIESHHFPFVVCLYQNSRKSEHVIAVSILDIQAACYLGGSLLNVSPKEVEIVIRNQIIPKDYFDKARLFLELFSVHIASNNESDPIDASCKGIHMVNAQMEKFQSLVQKKRIGSHVYKVNVDGYGSGRIFMLIQ